MNDLDMERAAEPLRTGAAGSYAEEAAVGLLIEHGTWLYRADFAGRCVELYAPGDPADPVVGAVRWDEAVAALDARALPCSTSEATMLRIAASIGGHEPVALRHCLGGLDGRNLRLVLNAIAHANGTRVSIR